jgi:hypothetical protein
MGRIENGATMLKLPRLRGAMTAAVAWLGACGGCVPNPGAPLVDSGFALQDGGRPGLEDSGQMENVSDAGDAGGENGIDAGADGGAIPPGCVLSFSATSLDFGRVIVGQSADLTFTISDIGAEECLVSGINLAPDSDYVFVLPNGPVVSQRLSPVTGGPFPSSLGLLIRFTPLQAGDYRAALDFTLPSGLGQGLPLSGQGYFDNDTNSCFSGGPANRNVGVVGVANGQYCSHGRYKWVGVNSCYVEVTIESVTFVPADSPWTLITPTVPVTVQPGQASPPFLFSLMIPGQPGSYTATLVVQTDLRTDPFKFDFTGTVATPNTQTDTFTGDALFLSRQFPLDGTPVPSSLAVSLDGVALPADVWSYNDLANTVVLADTVALQASDTLVISYWISCD